METSWSVFNMAQSEYEMEIMEEESVQTPSTSSHEHGSKISSKEEMTLHNKNWIFTNFEVEPSVWTIKHDQPDVSKIQDHNMDKILKNNEALHGASMTHVMVMSGSHSFTWCLDSNNHIEGHDIKSSSKFTVVSSRDEHSEEKHHGTLVK